jgi:SulP family sulfate permease
VVHALLILAVLLSLAPLMSYVPMASLAALLFIVAWNMSEAKHFIRLIQISPRRDMVVLLTCFGLTVLFDMVVAVTAGIVLAAMLFIHRMAELTGVEMREPAAHPHTQHLPPDVAVYDINGPLFFGAAEKAMKTLRVVNREMRAVILDMIDVSMMDVTGMMALESLVIELNKDNILVIISGLQPKLILRLRHAGIRKRAGNVLFSRDLEEAAGLAAGKGLKRSDVRAA